MKITGKIPQRYIDRAGIDDFAAARIFSDSDLDRLMREKDQLLLDLAQEKAINNRQAPESKEIEGFSIPLLEKGSPS